MREDEIRLRDPIQQGSLRKTVHIWRVNWKKGEKRVKAEESRGESRPQDGAQRVRSQEDCWFAPEVTGEV